VFDHAAILADFEAWLVQDGRPSHGTPYLTRKLAELRAEHRIDEDREAATIRRFSTGLTETFLGLVPTPDATDDPLSAADPVLPDGDAGMAAGAPADHLTEGASHGHHHRSEIPDRRRRASAAAGR
jgi:hypothetical protein